MGKSSLLSRSTPSGTTRIDLDDLATRTRATSDPILFARDLTPPLIVDEIQYAPQLLSPIKVLADRHPQSLAIWLTGSQSFEVMRGVRETLAGRVVILNLYGLSIPEKGIEPDATPQQLFREFFIGTSPALRTDSPDIWSRAYEFLPIAAKKLGLGWSASRA